MSGANVIITTGSVLGGIGLFLLAIGMMTDGLKLAAGPALRRILSEWTLTPLRGLISGFGMTALVQSSSAVTVASIGFVNAGLLEMRQALGIIYGANVGTTMTAWLVAFVGFELNIQAVALPMIGMGMLVRLVLPGGRLAAAGLALVGFGLFFVGLDVLKSAFDGLIETFDVTQFTADGVAGVATFMLLGVVMTIVTQSSSAAIALTITAVSSGVVGTFAAAAMVIGANVGTTSTAVLASIGATSAAKRVSAAQVVFNLLTAAVALATLPVLFYLIGLLEALFGLEPNPGVTLALFHTVFNVLGVLLIFPLNDRLVAFLERRFLSWEETQSHPRFLDKTIAATPDLAVNALVLELQGINERVCQLASQAIHPDRHVEHSFAEQRQAIVGLCGEVSRFIVELESASLSNDTIAHLTTLMRIEQYLLSCSQLAEQIAPQILRRELFRLPALEQDTGRFFESVVAFISAERSPAAGAPVQAEVLLQELQAEHDRLKASLLLAATRAETSVHQMSHALDCIGDAKRMAQQWFKATNSLALLQADLDTALAPSPDAVANVVTS